MSDQSEPAAAAPAGWFQDPEQEGVLRWWDGARWTEHRTAAQAKPGEKHTFAHWLVPSGRSGWAIAAGYAGLLSVLIVRKAGIMGVVVIGGEVRPGDPIAVEIPSLTHQPLAPV